jgi:branched-chain amino acid transport system permease protein
MEIWARVNELPQQLVNGILLGSVYALIALGYTMVYGVLRFINFAHGDVMMVGAFIGLFTAGAVQSILGGYGLFGAVIVLIAAMIGCAVLGMLIERTAYRPLRSRPRLTVLITAIGVALFLEYAGQMPFIFGPNPQSFPQLIHESIYHIGSNLAITSNQVIILVVTMILMFALQYIVQKTRVGTAMRALSNNPVACSLMGVNTNVIVSFTFGIGSALAGAASILYCMNYPQVDPMMGIQPGIKAFVAAVLGGIGNIPGAALGALIIGVLETLVAAYISPSYRDAVAFMLLIFILLVKPSGLLGKPEIVKV